MAELWAYCADCQRWYYCCPAMLGQVGMAQGRNPVSDDRVLPDCPVCQSPPTSSRTEREAPEALHS